MGKHDIDLMAHLMRRAGFGATQAEIEACVESGYEATVEQLLDPGDAQWLGDFMVRRFDLEASGMINLSWLCAELAVPPGYIRGAIAGEDDALLARYIRHRHAEGHQRQGAFGSGEHVQALRDGQVRRGCCWSLQRTLR